MKKFMKILLAIILIVIIELFLSSIDILGAMIVW